MKHCVVLAERAPELVLAIALTLLVLGTAQGHQHWTTALPSLSPCPTSLARRTANISVKQNTSAHKTRNLDRKLLDLSPLSDRQDRHRDQQNLRRTTLSSKVMTRLLLTVVTTLVGVLRKGLSIWAAVARMRRTTCSRVRRTLMAFTTSARALLFSRPCPTSNSQVQFEC